MQRLFSMFPSGLAGVALVLLRIVCALPILWANGFGTFTGELNSVRLIAILLTLLLLCGIFTPIACSLTILEGIFVVGRLNQAVAFPYALHMLTTTSLMMLGPGAYSIDARLFGRRLIVAPKE